MKESDFKIRALEVHSQYVWDFQWIMKVLDYMENLGYNTLVLHRNDIVELLEYPGAIFGYEEREGDCSLFDVYGQCFRKIFRNTPTRRSNIFNKRAYMKRLLSVTERKGIDVYIENKEIYFPDILPELKPELIHDGHVCPTDPFWKDYIHIKYTEFFRDYPEVKGVITSIATSESKISIKNNRCSCERCRQTHNEDWYQGILNAMYEVLSSFGKDLVVRDFVFDAESQREIAMVMENLPKNVIISLKNTPHDYYPTFPINKRVGNVGNHRQWIEFDTMGQYFGLGIGVADLTEDYRRRLQDAILKGVEGTVFRTDWESLDGHSAFITPNIVNVYAGALLSSDTDRPSDDIYLKMAEKEGWCNGNPAEAAHWLKDILSQTWNVTRKTVFADDCVFSDSSTLPISLEHAVWLAEEKNSLRDWVPMKKDSISPIRCSVEKIYREKALAAIELSRIISISDDIPASVNPEKGIWLKEWMHVNSLYLELFTVATEAIIDARYIKETKENDKAYIDERVKSLHLNIGRLGELKDRLKSFWREASYSEHIVYTLLDPDRVDTLIRNLSSAGI